MKKKKIFLIFLLVFTVFVASGCVEGQVDVEINGDGSADLTYAMIIDKKDYDSEMLDDFLEKLEEGKFTVEKRDMGEIILVNASVYLPKFITVFDPLIVYDYEYGRIPVEYNKKWLTTEYIFDINYDMQRSIEFIETELGKNNVKIDSMAFSVRLPNEADDTNADNYNESEKRYTWELDTSGDTDIYLKTTTINKINLIVTIGIPLFALIAIINERRKKGNK